MKAEQNSTPVPHVVICPNCGKDNNCKMDASCWCMSKPSTGTVPKEGACKCESCFDKEYPGHDDGKQ